MSIMNMRNTLFAMALGVCSLAQAQDTYLNDRLTATDDLNGSARYVGMGGALGALGADLSVISSNPAGIGLYRKSDVGMSFGVIVPNGNGWDKNDPTTYGEKLTHASFDQFGMVFSVRCESKLRYANFAVNYQKKANYNMGFFADNGDLGGLSQMDQLAELATAGFATSNNLAGLAAMPVDKDPSMDNYYLTQNEDGNYQNDYPSYSNNYTRHQTGSLQAYDFNASFNIEDRVYLGATFGVDNVSYRAWSEYAEYGSDDALNSSLYNDVQVDGYGLNAKFGIIVRPVEDNPFRFGVALETPTWYRLKNSTIFNLDQSDRLESYLEYTVRTPWKGRFSLGSTVSNCFAWGVEYEYANYAKTAMGYPKYDYGDPYGSALANDQDFYMNQHTKNTLKGQHTIKAGVEYKPIDGLAIRLGYNYITSRYKDDATFDQYSIDSYAMDYSTSTDYMILGDANIVTVGLGYTFKKFYVDLAYKFRSQSGDFYAFDTSGMEGQAIAPVNVNLNKNQVVLGFGFKF
ncbi:MAG: hypothetical protein LUC44_02500 [Prevotellaceae bacterium]|nr:hypothetical protein [Prevotellaceae bacterium]